MTRPRNWVGLVNEPMTEKEAEGSACALQGIGPMATRRGKIEQASGWAAHTMRAEGRPKAIKPTN